MGDSIDSKSFRVSSSLLPFPLRFSAAPFQKKSFALAKDGGLLVSSYHLAGDPIRFHRD